MALVIKDRVKETTTTSGTGTYNLGGASTGFESFASVGNGNTTYYCCTDGTNFEIGIGTYTASGTTLDRTTILQSSNSDNAVSWADTSAKNIFCTMPSDKSVFLDGDGDFTLTGANANLLWDKSADTLNILDGAKLTIGTGNDLTIRHDTGHTFFEETGTGTGSITFKTDELQIKKADGGARLAQFIESGAVTLYNNGAQSLETVSGGVKIYGGVDFGNASNNDVSIIRTGYDATTYGFNIKYLGSGSGNNNALAIFTDNQTGGLASLEAITINQNGYTRFSNQIQVDGDIFIGDDLDFFSDGAILKFGVNDEVTLTHVHDTGLLLNGAMQLQFGDDGTYIHQSADGVLDLVADGELELNGALVDINSTNGNVDIGTTGGNVTLTGDVGNMTFTNNGTGDILLGNFKFDSDQTVGSGQDNYVLTYDHSTTKIGLEVASGGGGASNLNGLSDVTIASVANNDLLKYNSTASEWQNTNLGLTVTPTLSTTAYYNDSNQIDVTITNHSTYDLPAYSLEVRRADNNNLIFDMDSISSSTETIDIHTDDEGRATGVITIYTSHSASNFDTISTDNFKVLVIAQDFGDIQSEVATLNVSVVARPQISFNSSTAFRYWRLADMDNRVWIRNWKAFTAINQGGTEYPSTEAIGAYVDPSDKWITTWTSDGQTNVIKTNFAYSATYTGADMFNANSTGFWTLGQNSSNKWTTSNGFSTPSAYQYEQILAVWDMGTARTIKSMSFVFRDQYTNTVASGDNAFIVQGSNDDANWTTVCTVTASDQDFSNTSGDTDVLVSDTS
tara:strand:+ start:653 stop:3025 length:2373 start_codon:yes stop_codon:yes gene_type:complete